tara:strand:- start:24368 stop:25876 length:1509 start_codon:yes stop_codon:yes gene_type:complete
MLLVPVILAGGVGTRLWPLSRESYPKQFISLFQDKSLFQKTILRSLALQGAMPMVIGGEEHRFLMSEQVRTLNIPNCPMLIEPCMRNTAPAVALAAFQALADHDDPALFVLPGDHDIPDEVGFKRSVELGLGLAAENKLVTFGISPTAPETGYGYIEKGKKLKGDSYLVKRFVEKPHLEKAVQFLRSQKYYWNSGMFLFKAKVFLQQLEQFAPDIFKSAKLAFDKRVKDIDFIRPDQAAFESCPSDSIDYAVMEKTQEAAIVQLQSPWRDIGAWDALSEIYDKDDNGNVLSGNVSTLDSKNCLLKSESRLLATVGVENLVVVETPDVVLVLNKAHSQSVKGMVSLLKKQNKPEAVQHHRTHRPWGYFESIDKGDRFQVKRISVKEGAKLSLQRHHHRSEHWVVVKGTARVTRGDEVFLLSENHSTYIPIGVTHRLENVGKIPLEIIEVQSGAYLGEDDIERLDDQYGRNAPKDKEKDKDNSLNNSQDKNLDLEPAVDVEIVS